jgi:hypothetical protein
MAMTYETLYNTIQAYAENTEQLFVANIAVFVQEAEDRIYNAVQLPALRKNVTGTATANNPYLSLPIDFLSSFSIAVVDSSGNYNYLLNKDVNFIREAYPNPTTTGIPQHYSLFGPQSNNINELTYLFGPTPDQNYTIELHYFYYPPTIVQGQITTLAISNAGTGYVNGLYQNVALTGGSGANAVADIMVAGGVITSVTLTFGGNFYTPGDVLSCASLGGLGTGLAITVSQISNATGTSWLGENYDPVLFYGAMREAMLFMKGEQDLVGYYEAKYQEAMQQLNRLGTGLERGDAYRDGQAKIKVAQ